MITELNSRQNSHNSINQSKQLRVMGTQTTTTNQLFHLSPTHSLPKMASHGKFEQLHYARR